MRIGAIFDPTSAAAFYRGVYPLEAMQRRGHEVLWPEDDTGDNDVAHLETCDVVFVFRRHEEAIRRQLASLAARGVGIVWDNDDDLSAVPKNSPTYKKLGGLHGQRRFADTVKAARIAQVVTTTTNVIKARYEQAGVEDIQVIENYLRRRTFRRPKRHKGVVVGWIAGMEHMEDAVGLRIKEALEAVQSRHPDLHVVTVGVDLKLTQRYKRHTSLHFDDLPTAMAKFDIGLAPLVDIPFNAARSNIKVKEYAASGVAWLASPRTPYRNLGEKEGGRLVEDGDWEQAVEALVASKRERKKLARAGQAWALSQTVSSVEDTWEGVYRLAAERARSAADRLSAR